MGLPRALGSSSTPERLPLALDVLQNLSRTPAIPQGLPERFEGSCS